MNPKELNELLGNVDIYLLDQVLKGRFDEAQCILDAGCGEGRNSKYLGTLGKQIHFLDKDPMAVKMTRMIFRDLPKENFLIGELNKLPYEDGFFDACICSAVLHFASGRDEFVTMWNEIKRVLKGNGFLFVRMSAEIGLSGPVPHPFSYSLTPQDLSMIDKDYLWEEPFKTILVADRSMAVLSLRKKS